MRARRVDRLGACLAGVLLASAGCAKIEAKTMGWVRVETEDLIIRTDVDRQTAIELATKWQRLRDAIAENELPCAFERTNVPVELVLLEDEKDMEDLFRRYTAGLTVHAPSSRLDSKTQYVMVRREAAKNNQLFAHELTHAAVAICFPGARPWLHEGMASFYETARISNDELVLGMPPYGFVEMNDVEPMFDIYEVNTRQTSVWMLPRRLAPDFDELRRMDEDAFHFLGRSRSVSDLRQTTAHYAGAWHAVHMLQFGAPSLQERFQAYLTRLARGDSDDRAWAGAFFAVDVAARYRAYLGAEYKIASRPVAVTTPREPSVHAMSEVDAALLWARLYGWSSEDDRSTAAEYLDLAASKAPDSPIVMLHRAAFDFDTEGAVEGERWLRRALGRWPDDPQVLATAMYWYARMDRPSVERAELQTWGEALGRSAQTAFQHAEHGEYLLRVAGDPEAALQSLESSLTLDATSWRTYALAGIVLADLGRTQQAIRAFQTAIALTGHAPADVRPVLQASIDELRSRARERSE